MGDVLNARTKAMIASVEAKTGKTIADFAALAVSKGLTPSSTKPGELISWLKEERGLGHGHAMAMAHGIKAVGGD